MSHRQHNSPKGRNGACGLRVWGYLCATVPLAVLLVCLILPSLSHAKRQSVKPPWAALPSYALTSLWKAPLSAPKRRKGYRLESAAPEVTASRIYIGSLSGVLVALDVKTGSRIWKVDTGGPIESRPLAKDGTIYIGNTKGKLLALDADTGALRWMYTGNDEITSRPLVYGEAIYVTTAQDTLLRLSKQTGARLGALQLAQFSDAITLRSQADLSSYGSLLLIALSEGSVVAYDMATDAIRWRQSLRGTTAGHLYDSDSTPLVLSALRGAVLVGTYRQGIYAIDPSHGAVVWKREGGSFTDYVEAQGTVYLTTADHAVEALDAATGAVKWRLAIAGRDVALTNPVLLGTQVVVGERSHGLYVIDPSSGALVGKVAVPSGVSASLWSDGKTVYVLSNKHDLLAYGDGSAH